MLVVCYHAERGGIPFGHPFFIPVFENDTVSSIKSRIKEKLDVPDREFKQWRLGKVPIEKGSHFDHVHRNLLREEDPILDLFEGRGKICIEHGRPHDKRQRSKNRAQLTIK